LIEAARIVAGTDANVKGKKGGGGRMAAAITAPAARSRSRSLLCLASLLGRLLLVLLLVVLRTLIAHIGLLSQAPLRFHVEFNQPAREDYSIRRKGVCILMWADLQPRAAGCFPSPCTRDMMWGDSR
jgi:hypothetical protein